MATLKSKRVDDGLTEVLGINHLLITGLAIVHCGEFGGTRNFIRAGIRRVFGSIHEIGPFRIVTRGGAGEHLKLIVGGVDTHTVAGHACLAIAVFLRRGAGQINKNVAHGAVGFVAFDHTGPTEPAACTVVAVAVVGAITHLETEVLVGWSVIQAQEAVVQATGTFEETETSIHVVDVPIDTGRINGRATCIILEATTPGNVIVV